MKEEQTPVHRPKVSKVTGVSTGRPRREIREPQRFREEKLSYQHRKGRGQGEDSDENTEEEEEEEILSPVKREPPSTLNRGRILGKSSSVKKRLSSADEDTQNIEHDGKEEKVQTASSSAEKTKKKDTDDTTQAKMLEMEERKVAMQEEMLKLQRQSVMLLQNVMERLEKVEAGQNKT